MFATLVWKYEDRLKVNTQTVLTFSDKAVHEGQVSFVSRLVYVFIFGFVSAHVRTYGFFFIIDA